MKMIIGKNMKIKAALISCALVLVSGNTLGQSFGSAVNVQVDGGVALLKAKGMSLREATGQGNAMANAPGNIMENSRRKLQKLWEKEYGVSATESNLVLGVGFSRLDIDKNRKVSEKEALYAVNFLYTWATQRAVVDIAYQMENDFSATAKARVPGTQEEDLFGQELANLDNEKAQLTSQIQKIVEQIDPVEALEAENELRMLSTSVSFTDRANRFLDGVIKKIDSDYDRSAFSKEVKQAAVDENANIKNRLAQLKSQLESLETKEAQIEKKINSAKLTNSFSLEGEVGTKVSLTGAVVIDSSEQIKIKGTGEPYVEVAVLMAWSPQLKRVGEAILSGKQIKVAEQSQPKYLPKISKVKSGDEYLYSLPVDGVAGSHLVINDKGEYEIYGVSVYPYARGNSSSRASERMARFLARYHMNCAVYNVTQEVEKARGELKSNDNGNFQINDKGGFTNTDTVCGSKAADAERKVTGEMNILSQRFDHPTYGIPVMLQAYGLSALNSDMKRKLNEDRKRLDIETIKEIQYQEAYDKQLDAEVSRVKNSGEAAYRGKADAIKSFSQKQLKPDSNIQADPIEKSQKPSNESWKNYSGGRGAY